MPVPVLLAGRSVQLEPLAPHHTEALAMAGAEDRTTYAFTPVPHGLQASHEYIDRALADQ
ncbi:acetyltransferase, partial [Streptomyces sp. WM4235]